MARAGRADREDRGSTVRGGNTQGAARPSSRDRGKGEGGQDLRSLSRDRPWWRPLKKRPGISTRPIRGIRSTPRFVAVQENWTCSRARAHPVAFCDAKYIPCCFAAQVAFGPGRGSQQHGMRSGAAWEVQKTLRRRRSRASHRARARMSPRGDSRLSTVCISLLRALSLSVHRALTQHQSAIVVVYDRCRFSRAAMLASNPSPAA